MGDGAVQARDRRGRTGVGRGRTDSGKTVWQHIFLLALAVTMSCAGCGATQPGDATGPERAPDPPAGDESDLPAEPGDTAKPAFDPAAWYASHFDPTARFAFEGTRSEVHWDDSDPAADANGMVHERETLRVRCTVDSVDWIDDGQVVISRITCDDEAAPMHGTWIADARGLYFAPRDVESERAREAIDPQRRVISARPVRRDETIVTESGFTHRSWVKRSGDTWCTGEEHVAGDESGSELCFEDGRGLVRASRYWAGGAEQEESWTRVEPARPADR